MIHKSEICNAICRKIRVTRQDPKANDLSKRELLALNAYLDLTKAQEPIPASTGVNIVKERFGKSQ